MKKRFTHFLLLFVLSISSVTLKAQAIYASLASGSWADVATWETFTNSGSNTPGAQGTGTPAANIPSGAHFVYIRSGHTVEMGASNRTCFGMMVEAGGKLWANETGATDRRLQLVNGSSSVLYPQTGTITNNGTIGGVGDAIFFETGGACQTVTISGTGTTVVRRFRMPGGKGATTGGVVNAIIDHDMSLAYNGNYSLSAFYNTSSSATATTDNYTLTINAGKTVTLAHDSTTFHSNSNASTVAAGTYTYNINGTLDLSQNAQTMATLTAISPVLGTVNLNINGGLKTGAAFNSSPVAPGIANLNIAAGVVVDATRARVMNFNGNSFTMLSGTAGLQRTILNDGTRTRFPVGVSNGSNTHVSIANTTGPEEVITVSLKNTFTNAAPANTLPREWNLVETTAGGNSDTLRFEWTTTDESNGFTGASSVFILHWNGTAWDVSPASVSGTGTSLDPYVAKGSTAFSQLGLFALSNSGTTPVAFVNVKAFQKNNGVQVEFGNATESDVVNYVVEKSATGSNFTTAETIQPKANNGGLSSYTYFDAAPNKGNNFYRIKVTERNGSIRYSNTLNIRLQTNGIWVNAYPNPVRGNNVNVQLENFDKSVYTISIYNQVGQRVYAKSISHNGGTATFTIDLPASVKKGMYNLQVSNTVTTVNNKIVVE